MLENSRAPGLVELERLPAYKVADGDVDPRTWPVLASDGRSIGVVKDLVVDFAALRARYIEVRLDERLHTLGDEQPTAVLIPMEYVLLDAQGGRVRLQGISSTAAVALPGYHGEPIAAQRGNAFDLAAEAVAEPPEGAHPRGVRGGR